MEKKRILFVANTAWYLVNFRKELIQALMEEYEVIAATPSDGWEGKIPCKWIPWALSRRSLNPLGELRSVLGLYQIVGEVNPTVLHSYTVKPVIYGTLVASIKKIDLVVNSVTGLGHLFISDRLVIGAIRFFVGWGYRFFSSFGKVYFLFQNPADRELYLERGFCRENQTVLVQGSGIDTENFTYISDRSKVKKGQILFVGRMIREKGIDEIFEAARELREKGNNCQFLLAGDIDQGNPSSYTKAELLEKCGENIRWLGRREDIKELLEECEILILPSYREGIPRSILEAFSRGVPVIATDVPGCAHLVKSGTGILIPAKDSSALASAIEKLSADSRLQESMRQKARELVVREFDSHKILQQTKDLYRNLLK